MTIETARSFFLWCFVINYAVLMIWFIMFVTARGWMQRHHGRWFRLTENQFDILHYAGLSIYKIGIILLNLVPWIALHIAG